MDSASNSTSDQRFDGPNDRRINPRVNVRGLQVAVQRKKWLWFKEYHACLLYDICLDGIGIVTNGLTLKPDQPLQLVLTDKDYQYLVEGNVVFGNPLDEFIWYGVAFRNTPLQLDKRIERWARVAFMQRELKRKQKMLKLKVQRQQQEQRAQAAAAAAMASATQAERKPAPAAPVPLPYKRRESRLKVPALEVRVRSWGLDHFDEFVEGTILEIGQFGLSIRVPPDAQLSERVRVEIQSDDKPLRLVGRICYREEVAQTGLCGIELLQVPVAYGQLYQRFLAQQKPASGSGRGDQSGSISA